MSVKKYMIALALGVWFGAVAPVRADRIAQWTPLQRLMHSPICVVGKVTSIEKETIEATVQPNTPQKATYTIALIKIEEIIAGVKNVTHLKVGFFPLVVKNSLPRPINAQTLEKEVTYCFFLYPHHSGEFYVYDRYMSPPLDASSALKEQFSREITQLKRAQKIFADPLQALKKENKDRGEAALVLLNRYRTYPMMLTGQQKVELTEISQEESRLIMESLAEADFKTSQGFMSPMQLILNLNLTKEPGFPSIQPVQGGDLALQYRQAYQKWLATESSAKYRIKKYTITAPKK